MGTLLAVILGIMALVAAALIVCWVWKRHRGNGRPGFRRWCRRADDVAIYKTDATVTAGMTVTATSAVTADGADCEPQEKL